MRGSVVRYRPSGSDLPGARTSNGNRFALSFRREPPDFDRQRLRSRLTALAAQNIFIGTSSWKYEGWLGQIYSRHRYMTRGRFSQKRFNDECLSEYAETFPIVCGDFSFYQFPSESYWSKLFGSAPSDSAIRLQSCPKTSP